MGKKILLIIFGGIAAAGLIITIVGLALGGLPMSVGISNGQVVFYNGRISEPLGNAPSWLGDGMTYPERSSNSESVSLDERSDEVRDVHINISAGNVKIESGKVASLRVDGPLAYTQELKDGVWIISTAKHYNISIFNFSWWGNSLQPETTYFTITVPESLEVGNIHLNAGELTLTGIRFENLDCSTDMGTIKINQVDADEAKLEVDMGNIEAIGLTSGNTTLTAGMGSISMDGEVNGVLKADCSMGEISVTVPRPADYGWDAEVSMGTISIDGSRRGGISSSSEGGNKNAIPYFDLECGMGSINVYFR